MSTKNNKLILITGAAGLIGEIGTKTVTTLISAGYPVRAMVRRIDERSDRLEKLGAEISVGDLTNLEDVKKAVKGVSRIYFSMTPSEDYVLATSIIAAVSKSFGNEIELFVNMSQCKSSYSVFGEKPTYSNQQRNHWLSETILENSGLPVIHICPTLFSEHPFYLLFPQMTIKKDNTIQLPIESSSKTNPIASDDIAEIVSNFLISNDFSKHLGKFYDLTGPKPLTFDEVAKEFSIALGREIKYVNVPHDAWYNAIKSTGIIGDHILNHFSVLTKLIAQGNFDCNNDNVELLTGKKATSLSQWVKGKSELFNQ